MIDPRGKCSCIALRHDHEVAKCERTAKVLGGQCVECHYWARDHRQEKGDD